MMNDDDDISEEEELRRRIPQGNSPYRRGLWAEAYHWVCWLLSMFDDLNELKVKGLSRRWGLKLSNWLWGIEGAVRRLVIAAALTLDVGELARAKLAPARRRPAHRHRLCRPSFCVLSIHGGGVEGAGRSASSQSKAARGATGVRPYGHIPFPADPLLALGEPRQRRQRAPGPRRRNPLDRWVRPSRQDPDYRPRGRADGEAGEAFGSPLLAGSQPSRHRARRTRPAPPAPLSADPMESLRDWRRVYDEWEKIIPASAFAARIHALQRVIADPEALIARTAQRLRQIRDRVAALVKDALPLLRQPRRDRTAPSRETNFLAARCHGAIFHPDTS